MFFVRSLWNCCLWWMGLLICLLWRWIWLWRVMIWRSRLMGWVVWVGLFLSLWMLFLGLMRLWVLWRCWSLCRLWIIVWLCLILCLLVIYCGCCSFFLFWRRVLGRCWVWRVDLVGWLGRWCVCLELGRNLVRMFCLGRWRILRLLLSRCEF